MKIPSFATWLTDSAIRLFHSAIWIKDVDSNGKLWMTVFIYFSTFSSAFRNKHIHNIFTSDNMSVASTASALRRLLYKQLIKYYSVTKNLVNIR